MLSDLIAYNHKFHQMQRFGTCKKTFSAKICQIKLINLNENSQNQVTKKLIFCYLILRLFTIHSIFYLDHIELYKPMR